VAASCHYRPVIIAPIAGFLLGFLDFVWIRFVPFPFGALGNSIAVWAVAAFLLTYRQRGGFGRALASSAIMLVVAVPSYYVAAALIKKDDWSNVANANTLLWIGLGVIAALIFGPGGVLARRPGRLRLPALGLPSAVLLAELGLQLRRLGNPDYETAETVGYSILLFVLALLVTALVGRTWRDRALAFAWSLPLAAAGYLLMIATLFGG
jgi:hypothetical protein